MCDFHHVGCLSTFSNRPAAACMLMSSCNCQTLADAQPRTGASAIVHQGRRHGPSITSTKSVPAGSLSFSQQGGPPCWASPLAFGLDACSVSKFGVGGGGVVPHVAKLLPCLISAQYSRSCVRISSRLPLEDLYRATIIR
jgi:hypothetical protein